LIEELKGEGMWGEYNSKSFMDGHCNLLKNIFAKLVSSKMLIQLRYYYIFGSLPNLTTPRKFNEKVQWRKLNERNPLFVVCADKVLVKDWVREKIGKEFIIPTLYYGKALPLVSERGWHVPLVIKANHGSGWNYFVKNEKDLIWMKIEKLTKRWLKNKNYGEFNGEWLYSRIKPQILVEPYIFSENNMNPTDYKVWVFNGQPKFIQVDTDRDFDLKESFYDLNWNKMDLCLGKKRHTDIALEKPKSLNLILELATKLGKHFDFVRVDFYEVNGKPYFGEMTFYPNAGYSDIQPLEWDQKLGDFWKIMLDTNVV
jgi:hypothetical protein